MTMYRFIRSKKHGGDFCMMIEATKEYIKTIVELVKSEFVNNTYGVNDIEVLKIVLEKHGIKYEIIESENIDF